MRKPDYWFLFPYLLILLLGFTFFFTSDKGDFVLLVNSSRSEFLDFTMPWITHFGDGWVFAIACLAFLIYKWRLGLIVTTLGLLQLVMSYLLKRKIFNAVGFSF